jgi:Tfp pilus assembly protein FimT
MTPDFAVNRPPGGRQRGFTLVEALVMLAIVAMAALVAIPNLQRVMIKTQTTQAIAGLAGAFDLARSEALRRHSPVGAVITTIPEGNLVVTVWEDFDPSNAVVSTNNNFVQDDSELVVERRTVEPVIEFSPSPPTSITQVVYRSDGSLWNPGNGGMVHLQDQRGNLFRVRVNGVTGSTRLEMKMGSTWEGRREKWSWKY